MAGAVATASIAPQVPHSHVTGWSSDVGPGRSSPHDGQTLSRPSVGTGAPSPPHPQAHSECGMPIKAMVTAKKTRTHVFINIHSSLPRTNCKCTPPGDEVQLISQPVTCLGVTAPSCGVRQSRCPYCLLPPGLSVAEATTKRNGSERSLSF